MNYFRMKDWGSAYNNYSIYICIKEEDLICMAVRSYIPDKSFKVYVEFQVIILCSID